jgi:hypothetical protein
VPTVLKSGSFNLLEPSGPVKACNGIALPYIKYGPIFNEMKKVRIRVMFQNSIREVVGLSLDEAGDYLQDGQQVA